jgi:hypothetical protein
MASLTLYILDGVNENDPSEMVTIPHLSSSVLLALDVMVNDIFLSVDCWDGPDGDPLIYHGYTLTTQILFRDVLVDAIKPYAFYASEYPLILSLENHCSERQQETLARHLRDVLGGELFLSESTLRITGVLDFVHRPLF